MAATVAASSTAALPVSVRRNCRSGCSRLRAQAVWPANGADGSGLGHRSGEVLRLSAQHAAQRGPGGVVAAHAVDAAAGRRRRRAQEDARVRRRVRREPQHRPREHLAQVGRAAVDVAADVVGVLGLERRPGPRTDRAEHDVAEAGREPLDLGLDRRRSCRPSSRWARGSTPTACDSPPARGRGRPGSAGRRARRAAAGWPPRADRRLGRGDLGQRAADVHGAGPAALLGRPRHRGRERVVDLEHARRRSGSGRAPPGSAAAAASPQIARSWRGVTSKSTARDRGRSASERTSWPGADLAAQRAQVGRHRLGDRLRAAARDRPADGVAERQQHEREGRRGRTVERAHRVRAHPGEERCGRRRARNAARARGRPPRASPDRANRAASSGWRGGRGGAEHDRRPGRPSRSANGRISAAYASPSRPPRPAAVVVAPSGAGRPPGRRRAGGRPAPAGSISSSPCSRQRQRAQERRADAPAGGSPSRRRGGSPGSVSSAVARAAADRRRPLAARAPSGRRGRARSRPPGRSGPRRRRPRRATRQPPRRNGRAIRRMGAPVM